MKPGRYFSYYPRHSNLDDKKILSTDLSVLSTRDILLASPKTRLGKGAGEVSRENIEQTLCMWHIHRDFNKYEPSNKSYTIVSTSTIKHLGVYSIKKV